MLINDFYTLTSYNENENSLEAAIALNAAHAIFSGHFPDNPVTPGVCMLQIIKELVEKKTSKKLFMYQCSNVKFMALINPDTHPNLNIQIEAQWLEDDIIKVKAAASFEETVALKLVCNFKNIA